LLSMSAAAPEARAVVARNFPAAWVAPAALAALPQKVSSLLQRIGTLDGVPVVSRGPAGLEALARFQTVEAARDAVQTLHGTDLRTAAEKRAANFQAPKESERFWLRVAAEAGVSLNSTPVPVVLAPGGVATAVTPGNGTGATVAASSTANRPIVAVATEGVRKRIKTNGVYLSPLPPSWAESDVKLLASPYGTVEVVKMEKLPDGQTGAYIDYQKETAASAARGGLDGLSLMGARMRCVMQEEPEPPKPTRQFVIYVDELSMPSRPEVQPRLDDHELFVTDIPRKSQSEDGARAWASNFGDVDDVVLLRDPFQRSTGKAYVRFRSHGDAVKALKGLTGGTDGSKQAWWSESERTLRGTRGPYGLDVLRRLAGEGGVRLQEIRQAHGAVSLALRTDTGDEPGTDSSAGRSTGTAGQRVHFVVQSENIAQADLCRVALSAELAKIHEAYVREVCGSLVLRGFPASWSEKGLKFVFAPFGGLSSVALEEEHAIGPAAEGAPSVRLAYVKLRNDAAMDKAVSNLNHTKVGDGDLVEECVVACHRWHPRAWSDGTFHVAVFIDQLTMSRRPQEAGPGPEDRELFVQNLPLQDMNRQQLQEYFEGFGEVEDLHLITHVSSEEPTREGYVRFRQHRDAQRCIEALTPSNPNDAEPTDLAGSWAESERALQRKANSYRFNLIAELVGADGSGLERLKQDAKLKHLWVLAESLQQKDRNAPPASGRQLHFVGRVQDEANVQLFRELLERALEETHTKITDRIEKRRRKAEAAAFIGVPQKAVAAATIATPAVGIPTAPGGIPATETAPTPREAGAPNGQGGWHPGGPGNPGGPHGWAGPPPPYWGGWRPPPGGGPPPPGFEGYPPHFPGPGGPQAPGGYPAPPNAAGGPCTVFEQMQAPTRPMEDGIAAGQQDGERRSRSRRRRHRGGDGGKDRKHRSGSRKERRRRRGRSGSDDGGGGGGGDGGSRGTSQQ